MTGCDVNTDVSVTSLFEPLKLSRGPALKNRFVLAPMTNTQSHADGTLSDDECHWLMMRAKGDFSLTMTCASHVQAIGQGFPGQLGVFGDQHLPGLTRLASGLNAAGSVSCLQLHHAGGRADLDGDQQSVGPSEDKKHNTRALTEAEIEVLIEDFVTAACRAQKAGFSGVEVHGAHGYILSQFLSPTINRRTDRWGGALENRARIIFEILAGIRQACRQDFQLGLRLSPERFGLKLAEIREVAQQVMHSGYIDYLDVSLWDVTKEPEESEFKGRSLMSYFTELERGNVRLGVAGKVMSANDAVYCLANRADFVLVGRAAILAHNFPQKVKANANYVSPSLPVGPEFLHKQGLGNAFVNYLRNFPGFVT